MQIPEKTCKHLQNHEIIQNKGGGARAGQGPSGPGAGAGRGWPFGARAPLVLMYFFDFALNFMILHNFSDFFMYFQVFAGFFTFVHFLEKY